MADETPMGTNSELTDRSVAELLKALAEQTDALVRQELELARAELTEKGKKVGMGVGMFGGAGMFGLCAAGALTACLILAVSTALAGWLAALIVAAAYGAIAGVLALRGRSKVKQAAPPIPGQTVESVKEDIQWTSQSAKQARR
jgi:Putative Actinobacterial Holin-X, holin superfamily III